MKFYGYEVEGEKLISLEEISLKINVNDLDSLIKFLQFSRSAMLAHGVDFGHEHFKDWLSSNGMLTTNVDLIIVNDRSNC